MRSRGYTTSKAAGGSGRGWRVIMFLGGLFFSAVAADAQRISILVPAAGPSDLIYAARMIESIPAPAKVLDSSQSEVAFRSNPVPDPFNMTTAEAKTAASVMGCDYFVVLRTGAQRRSSFSKPDYFEAFATHYVVDGRTGEMLAWVLKSFEANSQDAADHALDASATETTRELISTMKTENRNVFQFEEVPDPNSPAAVGLKPPVPYSRIKPEYTATAFLYDVRATVDIEAAIDQGGRILETRIVRWAGFGLEQSVEKAVRKMNWRPAMRNGKPLPMRVLLRYNFKKVDKE